MPYLVNGQPVPEELILQESERISRDLRWRQVTGENERARRLRAAAEHSAINRIVVEQAAAADPRPVDSGTVETQVAALKGQWKGGEPVGDSQLRELVERNLRLQRLAREMTAGAPQPTAAQIEAFYNQNRENFRTPELFEAAHIVKHLDGSTEEQARAAIEAALAELEAGAPFAAVADRHSDCKGNGGDLGKFRAGQMVPEFEAAIRPLGPGQRTGIFRTPFGFHIAELRDKTVPGPASFEDVHNDIERVMAIQNQHETYLRAVAELRARANICQVPA